MWHPTTRCRRRRSGARASSRGIALADYAAFLDERATFMGQWGLKPGRGEDGAIVRAARRHRGAPAAALLARPHPRRGHARRLGRVRVLPGGVGGRRPRRRCTTATTPSGVSARRACSPRTAAPAARSAPSGCGSTSRASAATGTCASSDFVRSRESGAGRRAAGAARDGGRAASTRSRRSCSPRTSTATTTS